MGCALRRMLMVALLAPRVAQGQEAPLPFRIGESLEYEVRVQRLGRVGTARMWIEGPVDERGHSTWLLRFDMDAGKGPIRARDKTASWLDPIGFAVTRFEKEERHPLSRSREAVAILADSGTWRDTEGPAGALGSVRPLDELSFLYFLRTLPIDRDTTLTIERHFDAARNPTIVRVLGDGKVETPAGIFRTRIVEMEVRDPKRYKGTGIIRLHLDAEACHVPVRIESRMPVLGATVLTLTAFRHPPRYEGVIDC